MRPRTVASTSGLRSAWRTIFCASSAGSTGMVPPSVIISGTLATISALSKLKISAIGRAAAAPNAASTRAGASMPMLE